MKRLSMLLFGLIVVGCSGSPGDDESSAASLAEEEQVASKPEPGDDAMVLVPGGEFQLGSNERDAGAPPQWWEPEHTVKVDPFYIDVYEVTYGQYMRFTIADDNDYKTEGTLMKYYAPGKEDFPVTNVTYNDAQAYCKWAGKRLPTEAEWEKAGRGPDDLPYPWGTDFNSTRANTNESHFQNTIEVGSVETDKTAYGAYDMFGNVQEWTSSPFKPYPKSPSRNDQVFKSKGLRTVRGASYAIKGKITRLWTRYGFLEKSQYSTGFRCAKDAPEEESQGDSGQ